MTNDEKKSYNSLVKRLNKAMDYMDDVSIPNEKKEPHISQLQELMADMNRIAKSFNLTEKEMMEGFEI